MNFIMNFAACRAMMAMHMVAVNIGNNAYNWVLDNAKPIVLIFVIVSGVILIAKKEVTKIAVWIIVSVLAIVMVFNTQGFADLLQGIGNTVLGI